MSQAYLPIYGGLNLTASAYRFLSTLPISLLRALTPRFPLNAGMLQWPSHAARILKQAIRPMIWNDDTCPGLPRQ